MPTESSVTTAEADLPELCAVAPQPERGILRAFVDQLDLSAPDEVSGAELRTRIAHHLAHLIGYEPAWKPMAAARLLHLGRVAWLSGHAEVPESLLEVQPETGMFSELGGRILGHIDVLRDVALILANYRHPERIEEAALRKAAEIVRSSQALRETLDQQGAAALPAAAPVGLEAPAQAGLLGAGEPVAPETGSSDATVHEVRVVDLRPKMVTAGSVMSGDGKVLLAAGHLLTPRVIALLTQVASERGVVEPILVHLPVLAAAV